MQKQLNSYSETNVQDWQLMVVLMALRVRRDIVEPHGAVPRRDEQELIRFRGEFNARYSIVR